MTGDNHIVIFSHGFGVQKESRGLFTDLASRLAPAGTRLFDYNRFNAETNELLVAPLSENVRLLEEEIVRAREENPDAIIDLICHSQGGIIAGLLQPTEIRQIILLAPPLDMDVSGSLAYYASRPNAHVDQNGESRISRSDGTTLVVPKEYWSERLLVPSPALLYNSLASISRVTIIAAAQDTILGAPTLEGIEPEIQAIIIPGNHEFGGENRKRLVTLVHDLLSE
jgi:hypothetical protein